MNIEEQMKKITHRFDKRNEFSVRDILAGRQINGVQCLGCKQLISKDTIMKVCTNQ